MHRTHISLSTFHSSICPSETNETFPHHLRLSSLSELFSLLYSSWNLLLSYLIRRFLFPFWCVFLFVACFKEFCLSRKAAFTGVSVRTAVALFFLVFLLPFLPVDLRKERTSSGVKDVLEDELVSAVLLDLVGEKDCLIAWFSRLIVGNFSITSIRCCSVCG